MMANGVILTLCLVFAILPLISENEEQTLLENSVLTTASTFNARDFFFHD
jgi:hypothetical protein